MAVVILAVNSLLEHQRYIGGTMIYGPSYPSQ